MERNKFTVSIARKVLRMFGGESLPSSSLPHWIADELKEEGLISAVARGSRYSYRLTDVEACRRYVKDKYTSGTALERWIEVLICLYKKQETLNQ